MPERVMKVLANMPQGLSEPEQAQARANIGAVSASAMSVPTPTYGLLPRAIAAARTTGASIRRHRRFRTTLASTNSIRFAS